MTVHRFVGVGLGLAGAFAFALFLSARPRGADEASRYPYDPVCAWGRLADGKGMLVRCIRREERTLLLTGAPLTSVPAASSASANAPASPPGPELSPDEIAKSLRV